MFVSGNPSDPKFSCLPQSFNDNIFQALLKLAYGHYTEIKIMKKWCLPVDLRALAETHILFFGVIFTYIDVGFIIIYWFL